MKKVKFRTSYFAKAKENRKLYPKHKHLSIARYTPDWAAMKGINEDKCPVVPTWEMINLAKNLKFKKYRKKYNKMLDDNEEEIIDWFTKNRNKVVILYCYEKPNDFCHRHLLAEWLSNRIPIKIKELRKY